MKKGDLIKFATSDEEGTTKFIFKIGTCDGKDPDGRDVYTVDNGIAFFVPKEKEPEECVPCEVEIPEMELQCSDVIIFEPEWMPVKEHYKNLNRTFTKKIHVNVCEFANTKDFDIYDSLIGYFSKLN